MAKPGFVMMLDTAQDAVLWAVFLLAFFLDSRLLLVFQGWRIFSFKIPKKQHMPQADAIDESRYTIICVDVVGHIGKDRLGEEE